MWRNFAKELEISDSRGPSWESIYNSSTNQSTHKSINIQEKHLVDGRTKRSRIKRETLVFVIVYVNFLIVLLSQVLKYTLNQVYCIINFLTPLYSPNFATTVTCQWLYMFSYLTVTQCILPDSDSIWQPENYVLLWAIIGRQYRLGNVVVVIV